MAWFDDLLPNWGPLGQPNGSDPISLYLRSLAGTAAPIPPNTMALPNPNFTGPGKDQFNSVRGLNEAATGSQFVGQPPLPPNIEARRPGLDGQGYQIERPPAPRNPVPATAPPMMGMAPPERFDTTGLIAEIPGAAPAAPSAPTERPGFFERNKEVFGPEGRLWGPLGALGRGMAQPSYYGAMGQLSQGFNEASQAAVADPMRRAQLKLLQAQVGKAESETDVRKQLATIGKSLPKDHPARPFALLGLTEKFAEKMSMDPNKLFSTGDDGKPILNKQYFDAQIALNQAKVQPPPGYAYGPNGTLNVVPGGPATHIAPEVAGRIALATKALQDLPEARKVFLREWSTEDMAKAQVEMGDVGRAQRTVKGAIESGLRMMTGAAAPESEVRNYMGMFMPKSTDSIATRTQKLENLEAFMRNAISIATQGRGGPPAVPSTPAAPTTPATKSALPGRSGTLPGGIKWTQE